ncbi:potassium uptake protein, TrkH family [Synechococcus sp. PCC 7502]|uniref:TrkH family potassium uptake protein n=1 Tax=Synechococcus sp. PCC 7502 TaxID=1173263 RepID=UPI00029FCF8E|nr:TrkH family potassium uptake protein [Synechococcus sp. PCC 7502]AFY72384.1 potassium uptake protein, TrkH family [Synechococcus sp. PCC 7502]
MTPARTICLGFVAVILAGAILLMLPISTSDSNWGNFITALFMSTSAVCVTGLAVVDPGTFYNFTGQAVLLLLCQIGGLGYMTATTFLLLLIGRKFSLREKVTLQQSLDISGIRSGVPLVKSIIVTTILLEVIGVFLMTPEFEKSFDLGRSLWCATFHSVSAFNNAGFSLFPNNLINYVHSPIINFTVTGLIILGGIGYQVILEVYLWLRMKIRRSQDRFSFSLNFKVATSTTVVLLLLGTLGILLTELNNPKTIGEFSATEKLMVAWFQSVTARTAGFNTIDYSGMTLAGLFVTIILMFIGASPSGTGGGIKTTTLRVLTNCTHAALQGEDDVHLYNRQISSVLILKAVGVIIGSMLTVMVSTTLLLVTEPKIDFVKILFESVSAFGTVGLSTGITAQVSALGQIVLILTMYTGRVGVLLLIGAIFGDSRRKLVKYPEETLLVG